MLAGLDSSAGAWLVGDRVNASGSTERVINPSDLSHLLEFSSATPSDVVGALPDIAAAATSWAAAGWSSRLSALKSFWEEIAGHAEEFALLDTLDAGLPIATTRADLRQSLETLDLLVGWSADTVGQTYPAMTRTARALTLRQPYGVVAVIVPYNHPAKFALVKTMPALLAGNVVILKPSEQAPMSAMLLGRLAARTLPPGVFNVVPGDHRIGETLVSSSVIGRVSFTGSTDVGLKVAQGVAKHLGSVHLELGGKNATVVLAEADLPAAARAAVSGMDFARSSGQACWSLSRIFVAESVADDFLDLLLPLVESVVPDDPLDEHCRMGPLSTAAGAEKFDRYRALSREGTGARLILAPDDPQLTGGYFRSPVVAAVDDARHPVINEEIFGPFLSVYRFDPEEDPAALVNASQYGLTASVWSGDLAQGLALAEQIDAGYIWVNSDSVKPPGVPFGAWKMSGYGKGMGSEELRDWTREKAVMYTMR